MLDIARLNRIRFTNRPLLHRLVGATMLTANYTVPPKVSIVFEGVDRLPDHPVIFAMNHTDRFNYMPFQYRLWRTHERFTATWVKGKYFEHPAMAWFMEKTHQLPTVSRGYIIARDMVDTLGRKPTSTEYQALRALVDGEVAPSGSPRKAPPTLLSQPRTILGRPFDPCGETYGAAIRATFLEMMQRFTELNTQAHRVGLDIVIFPQGTRSIRLSQGHMGLAQMALHLGATVVPIGCNGSDRLYPGDLPWARPGRVVYRFGEPITPEQMAPFRPDTPFQPFLPSDEERYRDRFQALVNEVMDRINTLLDPPYQYSSDLVSDGAQGTSRFL
ncbi:MAG: 1-acyl-sn-glycerol-3-phosphate acyltransferase [Myxococcota bacterium]